jgi:UDP:flavonoid glycosyltransferase YjiC (YdhE family)
MFERFGVPARVYPTTNVEPTPPRMRLAVDSPRLDMRYIPYNGTGLQPPGLTGRRSRPRACVTWGHTASGALGAAASDPQRQAVTALAQAGVDVLVATTAEQAALLDDLPDDVRVLSDVPLQLVLPHCDVVVQQGGDGTTLTAATLGLPQLAISRKPDAELAPGRLAASGAGIHLRYQELRQDPAAHDVIRDAVGKLLGDAAYRDAAAALREEIEAQPAPVDLVPALTAWAEVNE